MGQMQRAVGAQSSVPVEYDLHGIVGVRLLGASESDVAAGHGSARSDPGRLDRDPDVVTGSSTASASNLRFLGREEAGRPTTRFLVLRSRKARARVQIPVEAIGGRCEIVCESGRTAGAAIDPIVNVTALAKGVVPVHARGVYPRGSGVLGDRLGEGGQTESLLGFMSQAPSTSATSGSYVSADGRRLRGIPEPVRVWDWHLDDLPGSLSLAGASGPSCEASRRPCGPRAFDTVAEASGPSEAPSLGPCRSSSSRRGS